MNFSMTQCWDCPEPFTHVLPGLLIGLGVAALGAFAFSNRHVLIRNFGRVFLIISAFWYLFVSLGVWRFGVAWHRDSFQVNRAGDAALLLAWYLISVMIIVSITRLRSTRHRTAA